MYVQGTIDGESLQRSVIVTYKPESESFALPEITVLSPVPDSYQAGESFTLAGRVTTAAGLQSLTINGQPVSFNDNLAPDYNFRDLLSFPADQNQLTAVIKATDSQDQVSEIQVSYYRDQTAPTILLDRALQDSPQENPVTEQPYRFKGTVIDENLASFFINDAEVGLTPLADTGQFSFDVSLQLSTTEPVTVVLIAADQAGNQTTQNYILRLDSTVTVSIVRPEDGSEFLSSGEPIPVPVTTRIEGTAIPTDISVVANLNDAGGLQLSSTVLASGDSGFRSGEVVLPAEAGDYAIQVLLQDATGNTLASTQHDLSVTDAQTIPLEVTRVEPADGATGIEPNNFISIFFNKPIDISKLTIQVHETAHGNTYVDVDELGTDGVKAKGYVLQEVHRDYEPVNGTLSVLPNNQIIALYPERDLSYAGQVFIEVTYDGEEMLRSQYRTRALPTFVTGTVIDQFGQPIPGIEVKIPQLSRIASTNAEGAFAFGYGDSDAESLPEGRYELVVNPSMKNPVFGSQRHWVNIQKSQRNKLSNYSLPLLSRDVAFVPASGRQELNLLQGELKLDLTQADLEFPGGLRQGDMHAQFTSYSQLPYRVEPIALPHWMYAIQPAGIAVEGSFGMDLGIPKLKGGYDHVPPDDTYVLLLGLDAESKRIVPVGVGQILNKRVLSKGELHYQLLDFIGYGLISEEVQPHAQRYVDGEINLQQLILEIQQLQ